jgi:hypothetical protein
MTVSQDAQRLLERLTAPTKVGVALLAIFEFCAEHREACWGWIPLGDEQIEGYPLDKVVSRARPILRDAFLEERPVEGVGELLGVRSSLLAIMGSGRITPENSAEVVRGLRAIDDALRGFHSARVVGVSDSMKAALLRGQLRTGKPLAIIDQFALYPRPARAKIPERGQGDPGMLLQHVAVIRRVADFEVSLVVHLQDALADQTQFKCVGVVPVVHHHGELAWQPIGATRYRVDEDPSTSDAIKSRVNRALDEIASQEAQVVLMPELVSGPKLRSAVAARLRERSSRGDATPLITLCGTSLETVGGGTRNQAAVLDSEGDIVWTQNKLHAYRFSAEEQSAVGFPLGPAPADRQEAIDIAPSALVIVDLNANLRVVVLICEDLIQAPPHAVAIQQMGVTTVLAPIMDRSPNLRPNTSLPDLGWLEHGALTYIRHPGASTFIANSGTLVVQNLDHHWSYAHAFTVPRSAGDWRAVPAEEAGAAPIGWILDLD